MPQITTNTASNRNGTGFEFIVEPAVFATLWKDITGRAVVTEADLSNIKALARFFESGLVITRNNHTSSDEAETVVADYYNRNR